MTSTIASTTISSTAIACAFWPPMSTSEQRMKTAVNPVRMVRGAMAVDWIPCDVVEVQGHRHEDQPRQRRRACADRHEVVVPGAEHLCLHRQGGPFCSHGGNRTTWSGAADDGRPPPSDCLKDQSPSDLTSPRISPPGKLVVWTFTYASPAARMLSAPAKSPADRFCPETAWMSAAVTPLRETVPPLAGHVGVPAGPGAAADPHSHREMPPLTAGWPKWMWAMNAGLDSAEYVSV